LSRLDPNRIIWAACIDKNAKRHLLVH
jgi:hypothetical protein